MIHQPMIGQIQAPATDISIHSAEILKSRQNIAALYAEYTNKKIAQIIKDMDRDHWLTAPEAVKYGLINKIITSRGQLQTELKKLD